MKITTLIDLYRHMEWADATVWRALLDNQVCRSDPKLKDYLYHLHLVQWAFLRVWRGRPADAYPKFDELPPLMDWARAYYGEVFGHLETFSDEGILEPAPIPWAKMVEKRIGRAPDVASLAETILQVALHSTYHRGQVNARLRQLGAEPPLVDFIAWVWLGRPPAEWPEQDEAR